MASVNNTDVSYQDVLDWAISKVGDTEEVLYDFLGEITLAPTNEVYDYWCDPDDVETFAETGMGGAHFGEFDAKDGQRPIVLISPATGDHCWTILGESFYEFLCLGCDVGYGLLIDFPSQPAQVTRWIEEKKLPHPREGAVLAQLREEFGLKPWPEIGNRLQELQDRYLGELQLP